MSFKLQIVQEIEGGWLSGAEATKKYGTQNRTTVLDLYDRKNIGWGLSDGMGDEQSSLAAWGMAIKNRNIENGLVFWYNRKRRHSALQYKTIEEFWNQKNEQKNGA